MCTYSPKREVVGTITRANTAIVYVYLPFNGL